MLEMLLTNFDLGASLERSIMCGLTDGREALLRTAGMPFDMASLAERRALDDKLPIVGLEREDVHAIVHGKAVMITTGGTAPTERVLVRMATAEEFMAMHVEACERVGIEPNMTVQKAQELTRHL